MKSDLHVQVLGRGKKKTEFLPESSHWGRQKTQLDKDKVLREGMQEAQLKSVPITPLSIISQLFFLFWQFMKFFPHT